MVLSLPSPSHSRPGTDLGVLVPVRHCERQRVHEAVPGHVQDRRGTQGDGQVLPGAAVQHGGCQGGLCAGHELVGSGPLVLGMG